jgi:hypothetical protein
VYFLMYITVFAAFFSVILVFDWLILTDPKIASFDYLQWSEVYLFGVYGYFDDQGTRLMVALISGGLLMCFYWFSFFLGFYLFLLINPVYHENRSNRRKLRIRKKTFLPLWVRKLLRSFKKITHFWVQVLWGLFGGIIQLSVIPIFVLLPVPLSYIYFAAFFLPM